MKRKAKIVCTMGNIKRKLEDDIRRHLQETAADDRSVEAQIEGRINEILPGELRRTVAGFIKNGMNVARLNMAHFDVSDEDDRNYIVHLIGTIRELSDDVAVLGDLQGPKIRIRDFLGTCAGREEVDLQGAETFVLTTSEAVSGACGASVRKPDFLDFIGNIKRNITDRQLPVEFWFSDGEVILEAREDMIKEREGEIRCRVKVPGVLKKNKGISVKNSAIDPGIYDAPKYPKDEADIAFLLEQGIDILALSMVNSAADVERLKKYILDNSGGEDFPVISKIETAAGVRHIDEIIDVSYGVMVARGDLALQTGIQGIPVLQKRIIEKALLKAKPVITATQMLSWMMYFIEPKRAEATDVANAVYDGTDALMLSEETADPKSRYPLESIRMMSDLALATEADLRLRNTLEYKYKVDQLHEKIMQTLSVDPGGSEMEQAGPRDREEMDRVSQIVTYNACKKAFELGCAALIVLTETGETARMISRFKPDMMILAGVYSLQVGRLLNLSYGVQAIQIEVRESGYPFSEFKDVIERAKERRLLEPGDLVVTVGRYPRTQSGAVTLLNVYTVE